MLTGHEIEAARNCISDDSFKKVEKLLGLKLPDSQLRRCILEAIALYRRSPNPAALDRKNLKALGEYFSNVLKHLRALQKLLPASGKHNLVQSNFLFAILEQGAKTQRTFEGRNYLQFQKGLNDLVEATEAASVELAKRRVPPNLRLDATKWLVLQLADIFQERTGKAPREHIKSNYDKSKYKGAFFQMADEILRRVGHQQENATRGRMITRMLQPPKISRPV
jgi:hypothetical protein